MKGKIGILLIFTLLLTSSFVSAYSFYSSPRQITEDIINGATDLFEPILNVLLGGQDWSGYLLFERFLLAIIFLSVAYLALGAIPAFKDQKGIRMIIVLSITLIGIRFIDYDWLYAITVQYGILAIALTSVLPFIIYFFFVHSVAGDRDALRKIAWIFFIVVYLGVWASVESTNISYIYFWTIIVSLVFLFFDGTIHRYYVHQKIKEAGSRNIWEHIARLRREISDINRTPGLPDDVRERLIKAKEKQIKSLEKHI